jgi:O-antigen ligase
LASRTSKWRDLWRQPEIVAHSKDREAGGWGAAAILALMILVTPAVGAMNEEMLQDTLKSAIVSFSALFAALLFFLQQRGGSRPLRWHPALWLPLLLAAYSLGSMAWSHTYLAGVEAIRWFIFSVLMWLALNCFSRERLPLLAWCVCGGAAVACLWAALQFLADFSLFPQGPHPASTFVNRNFFAEFAVCTLPFAALLVGRSRQTVLVALLSALVGLIILTLFMTGTRAALIALWLQLLVLFPLAAWRWRAQLAWRDWGIGTRWLAAAILVGVVIGLGSIPTADAKLAAEGKGVTALERAFQRTASIGPSDASLSMRLVMWRDTTRMIAAHPLFGVGAGAWENEIPLYQADGAQLETDFYVHNEFLQLIAEYGIAGWLFLIGLLAWLLNAARRTWRARDGEERQEAPWRAMLLCSLLVLMLVSNVGFAWRMASTGAIFALCLGALAASDARLAQPARWMAVRPWAWRPAYSALSISVVSCALALAAYITQQAAQCERAIVRAARISLVVAGSADPNSPRWDRAKAELLALVREGVAINPHYRKITPMPADELARWGDWNNAIWIWESVLSSRPYVVAILTNVARGYLATGNPAKAAEYLERAKRVQPGARSVRSAEVLLMARTGRDAEALELGRRAIDEGIYDFDLSNVVFVIGWRRHDFALAERAMQLRINGWPESALQGYMQLGMMYWRDANEADKALGAYGRALQMGSEADRKRLWPEIPPALRGRLDPSLAPAGTQTSASKA